MVEVYPRVSIEPAFDDCVVILSACIRAAGSDIDDATVEKGLTECGLASASSWSSRLVGTFFELGEHSETTSEPAGDVGSRRFPTMDFIGTAVALWGASAPDVWGWTVPEWNAARDAHIRVHDPNQGRPKQGYTSDEALYLADVVNQAKAAEAAERERMKTDGGEAKEVDGQEAGEGNDPE